MKPIESLCIPKVIFRNCALDVDGLTGPDGAYKFEDIRAMVSELFDKADLHVVGDYVAIDFPAPPGPDEEPSGEPRKRRKSNLALRRGVSAAAFRDGTIELMDEPDVRLSKALTRMLLEKISNDPGRADAVLDAFNPGPAEVQVLLDLGKHLAKRSESRDAALIVLRRARPLACTMGR